MSLAHARARAERTKFWVYTIFVVAFAAMAMSCSTMPDSVRALGHVSTSDVEGKVRDTGEKVSTDGTTVGTSLEIAKEIDYLGEGTQVGLRFGLTGRDYSTRVNDVPVELEALDVYAAPVLRGYVPLSDDFRLYGEGFVGYSHSFGKLRVGDERDRADGGGLLLGAGLGGEWILDQDVRAVLGVEWQQSGIEDLDGLDFDSEDMGIVFGVSISF